MLSKLQYSVGACHRGDHIIVIMHMIQFIDALVMLSSCQFQLLTVQSRMMLNNVVDMCIVVSILSVCETWRSLPRLFCGYNIVLPFLMQGIQDMFYSLFFAFFANLSVSLSVLTENAHLANLDASLPRHQRVEYGTVSVDFYDVLVAGEVTRFCLLQYCISSF